MRKKHVILWLALATLIAGTSHAANLVRHYKFEKASNLGQATVGPDAAFKSAITHIASPGGWAFEKVPYLQQTPASAAPDSRMGISAGALACWFKTTDNTTSRQSLVFGAGSGIFLLDMVSGGKIEGFVRGGDGTSLALQSPSGLANDLWHHAAVTWSGTPKAAIPGDSTLRLYIDGKPVRSKQDPAMGSVGIGSWCIGSRSTKINQFPFNGYVSDVRIYAGGAVLSDAEVAVLCDSTWVEKGFSTRRAQFDIIDYRAKTDIQVDADEYFVDMDRVQSAADLEAVPGIKIAWKLPHAPREWIANVCDVDGDGKIELFVSGSKFIFRYNQDGQLVWTSEPVNKPLGNESGMAIEDLDADGKYEVVFNVYRQLWCLDAETGKTNWKIDLPESRNNFQAAVVGHFLDRKQYAVVCRVNGDVFCYDPKGAEVWRYRIQNSSLYGHDMAHYDADGDGLDEVYMSLSRKFLALGGDGKLRWADNCGNHSDFILCGDVDGDGDREIVYDSDGCGGRGPIVCRDGRSGKIVKKWTYDRPGEDHLQKATLGDFDPSRPGVELAAIGKRDPSGGLILWSEAGKPAWRKDKTGGWVTWGDWNGDGHPEILVSRKSAEKGAGFQVWTGAGKCLYAINGIGAVPLGVETAARKRPDLDGNNKADVLLLDNADAGNYIVLMEAAPAAGDPTSSIVPAGSTPDPATAPKVSSRVGKSPNFLFILADDLGWADVSPNNKATFYDTPNIQRLADSGLRFSNAYAMPVCSPTRATLMTGKYSPRTGVTDYIAHSGGNQPQKWRRNTRLLPAPYRDRLDLDELTLAEALKRHGYVTFFAGKWHLGLEGFLPEDQGFDVNRGGIDRGCLFAPGTGYFSPYKCPRLKDGPDGEHLPDRLATETVRFIEANKDKPFLAYLAFHSVHTPLMGRPDLVEKYKKEAAMLDHSKVFGVERPRKMRIVQNHAVYAAMVEAMDLAIGKVLDALDEHRLTEDTVVIFFSDNGGMSTAGGHPTSNLPLRAGKGWLYEGGIRVPCIVRAPGLTQPGSVSHSPIVAPDFYPTLLDLAGLDLRPRQHVDGVSFKPALAPGSDWTRGQPIFWHYPHYGNQGGAPAGAVRDGDWKLIEWYEDGRLELFNLADDIGEATNLANAEPERAARMKQMLHDWRAQTGAIMPTNNPNFDPDKPEGR